MRATDSSPSTSSITSAWRPADSLEPVDRGNVGMIQGRERLRLALEPRQTLRVRGERIGQDLDRDLAAETGIGGAVDRAHAALAELGSGFVDQTGAEWARVVQ